MIHAIFSDIGGVLGSNGWDRSARRATIEQFNLDWRGFEERHELVVNAFETGGLSLGSYLDRTVFYAPRNFSKTDFQQAMFSRSRPFAAPLEFYAALARSGKYLMAALNNESLEMNLHRIKAFGLRSIFSVFFSSCFLGIKKPNDAIYLMAIRLTQLPPEECLFVDDRSLNVERAERMGMQAIQCTNPDRLPEVLKDAGIKP